MSAKKETKKYEEFLTGSVLDNTNPMASIFYDAPCDTLFICVNYGCLTFNILSNILAAFSNRLSSKSKIKIYHA